ncbi:hypothetical protein QQF64_004532 [Cirrhinus molitorella]|uniref:Uncharacterized protein n=1 Tax=Cirrhinus molitorella TaxID=172907 RepID=A0ABR3MJQ7_9TELE
MVFRCASLVSGVRYAPLMSARSAGIPRPTHLTPPLLELIPLSTALPIITAEAPEVAVEAAETLEVAVPTSAPCAMVAPEDSQRYYSWRSFGPGDKRTQDLWVDLNSMHQGPVRVHTILSNTHRQASRVALTFDFLFYGHQVRQITIATGGIV